MKVLIYISEHDHLKEIKLFLRCEPVNLNNFIEQMKNDENSILKKEGEEKKKNSFIEWTFSRKMSKEKWK